MISPIPTEFPGNSHGFFLRPCSTLFAPWNSSKTVWIQRSFLPPRRPDFFNCFGWDGASNFHGVLWHFTGFYMGKTWHVTGFMFFWDFLWFFEWCFLWVFSWNFNGFFTMTWWRIFGFFLGGSDDDPILAFPWVAPGKPSFMTNGLPSGKLTQKTMDNHR